MFYHFDDFVMKNMSSFAKELESSVCKEKCVGFRRMLNANTHDITVVHRYVLADVALENMDEYIEYLLQQLNLSKLKACMFLETKHMLTLPTMIHYMDTESCEKHCDKALRQLMLERIWSNL